MRMRLGLSRRTVRSRFTALYGVVFLLSGAGLLAIVAVVVSGGTRVSESAPAGPPANGQTPANALPRIHQLQDQLAQAHANQSRRLPDRVADRAGRHGGGVGRPGASHRGPRAAPAADDDGGDPADLRGQPARTAGRTRPRRRGEGPRRHHRRTARTPGARLRRPAPFRRQRLPRAPHPAGHHAGVAGRGGGQAGARSGADDRAGGQAARRTRPGRRAAGRVPRPGPYPAR